MRLFGFKNKAKTSEKESCCTCNVNNEVVETAEKMKKAGGIKVLGGGCAKCHELEANTIEALATLGLDEKVELITDFSVIATYGVMSTPSLVIDNKVVSHGKVLKSGEIAKKFEM